MKKETEHLLSTEANKERLMEDVFNDEKRQGVKDLIDAHKQETLEEVAEQFEYTNGVYGFKQGVKWQQEQDKKLYSEEDLKEAYKYGRIWDMTSFEDWFEQFKNEKQ